MFDPHPILVSTVIIYIMLLYYFPFLLYNSATVMYL